jgi:gamma-F420-2:alpha-L-glutamate ligase|tara:strand:+ start:1332 stop:2288 length:957 start_codon:yes stop_codon:yes gene_type:complete
MISGWILYKNELEESYETQRLVEEFESQDVKVRVVHPDDVDIFVDRDDRKSILVGGKARALPDFVIPRTGSGTTYFIKAILRHLERMNVVMINGSDSIDGVKDKLYTQQILGQSNLPVPKTLLVKHPINVDWVEKNIGFPVIIKTLSGSFGAGVFLAETKRQFKDLIKLAEITSKSYNIIVQEFIKESFGRDIRAFVLNGKVIGCMMRQATDDDFRANITRGGEGIPYQIDEEIEWLGGECARLLGLDIAGVDLLFHNGGYVICEVNSSPGFEGMDSYTKTNIAEQIVHYIRLRLGIIESPKPKLTRFLEDGDEDEKK